MTVVDVATFCAGSLAGSTTTSVDRSLLNENAWPLLRKIPKQVTVFINVPGFDTLAEYYPTPEDEVVLWLKN